MLEAAGLERFLLVLFITLVKPEPGLAILVPGRSKKGNLEVASESLADLAAIFLLLITQPTLPAIPWVLASLGC